MGNIKKIVWIRVRNGGQNEQEGVGTARGKRLGWSLVTSLYIAMILFWFYFNGLSNRIIRIKYLVTGDWSQSYRRV